MINMKDICSVFVILTSVASLSAAEDPAKNSGLEEHESGFSAVVDTSFFSNAMGENRNVSIYLPKGYDRADTTRYPVIYFLHGRRGDHTSHSLIYGTLDKLIGIGRIEPVILVKPDGSKGSQYVNSELYGRIEDYIVFDLVDYIDANYKAIADRNKRSIMGFPMGGFGAMRLALKHPDIYRGVASHSAPLDGQRWFVEMLPLILAENGGSPPYNYRPDAGPWTAMIFAGARVFSPNPEKPPYYVDLPLDSDGNFVPIWNTSPAKLVADFPPDTDLRIYFDCGRQDKWLIFNCNTTFADSLDKYGLEYEFQPYDGGHSHTLTANRLRISIAFLDSVMRSPAHKKERDNP